MSERPSVEKKFFVPLLLTAWALATVVFFPAHAPAVADLRVLAAASLEDAIGDANMRYQRVTRRKVVASFGGSDTLAQQIENGASADIFISADIDCMDDLAKRSLIKPETRFNFLGNNLVLIASVDRARALAIGPNFPLAQALGDGRLAIANPASVPAGRYGKAALETLGVWASVEGRLAVAGDVRAALALVSGGEAPLGIVYQTDAAVDKGVYIVGTFPVSSHPPIIYPLAVTAASTNSAAKSYVAFLQSSAIESAIGLRGFALLRQQNGPQLQQSRL
jgi:molybdate transport system substrate-binding protein